jgi:Protein of unknown function (DUF551)
MTAQWRPIETAPKDGTDVLLYLPNAHPPVRVGRYVAKGVIRSDYWFYYSGVIESPREWEMVPSHWMPLPEPPK